MRPRIYLAARYQRRLELCRYREQLQALGYGVQARWLDGGHQISVGGVPLGDDGEALVEGGGGEEAAALRAKFAQDDMEDLMNSTIVISFTEPPRSGRSRGGRHVEFGMALVLGQQLIVVGHRENLFHWLPVVHFFPTWEEALKQFDVWEEEEGE